LSFIQPIKDIQDTHADLLKITWELSYIPNNILDSELYNSGKLNRKISIIFQDSLPLMYWKGVCNSGFGRFYISSSNDSIRIKGLNTTLMGCPYEFEESVYKSLFMAYRLKITGDELVIFSKGDFDLHFRKKKQQLINSSSTAPHAPEPVERIHPPKNSIQWHLKKIYHGPTS
jgi:hypothetical protein